MGSGAAALGLSGVLDPAGVRVLAGLLDGVGPDGARLVEPVLRADPAGRVPALPIVTAARAAAAETGTDLPVLLGSELYRHTAAKTLGGGSKGRGIRADVTDGGREGRAGWPGSPRGSQRAAWPLDLTSRRDLPMTELKSLATTAARSLPAVEGPTSTGVGERWRIHVGDAAAAKDDPVTCVHRPK